MREVVLATGNAGKVAELQDLLEDLGLVVIPQSRYAIEAAEETGLTFVENALLKARHAAQATGLPAIADDSGLEVDALDGAPGIYSARYAGADASDADNNAKLLAALAGLPETQRRARFHCVLVYLRHPADPTPLIAQGRWEGLILEQARGTGGFGYDPLFYLPELGLSSAELEPAEKQRRSHRGQALRELRRQLAETLEQA